MKKLIAVLLTVAMLLSLTVMISANASPVADYATAEPGDLLYTVNFNGDSAFAPAPIIGATGANIEDNFDITISADGSSATFAGKETGAAEALNFWGGAISGLTADADTHYTMVYKAKSNANVKNDAVGVGGLAKGTAVVEGGYFNNYCNHSTTDGPRTALSYANGKTEEYLNFSEIEAYDVDDDGFVTMVNDFDGTTYTSYILKDGAEATLDAGMTNWIELQSQTIALDATNTMCFAVYCYRNVINTTIKDVKYYKGIDAPEVPTYNVPAALSNTIYAGATGAATAPALDGAIGDGEYLTSRTTTGFDTSDIKGDLVEYYSYDDDYIYVAFNAKIDGNPEIMVGFSIFDYVVDDAAMNMLLNTRQQIKIQMNADGTDAAFVAAPIPVGGLNEAEFKSLYEQNVSVTGKVSEDGVHTYEMKVAKAALKEGFQKIVALDSHSMLTVQEDITAFGTLFYFATSQTWQYDALDADEKAALGAGAAAKAWALNYVVCDYEETDPYAALDAAGYALTADGFIETAPVVDGVVNEGEYSDASDTYFFSELGGWYSTACQPTETFGYYVAHDADNIYIAMSKGADGRQRGQSIAIGVDLDAAKGAGNRIIVGYGLHGGTVENYYMGLDGVKDTNVSNYVEYAYTADNAETQETVAYAEWKISKAFLMEALGVDSLEGLNVAFFLSNYDNWSTNLISVPASSLELASSVELDAEWLGIPLNLIDSETPDEPDEPTQPDEPGDEPSGDDPAGDDPAGDDPAGDDPAGDDPAGDDPAGDEPAGDEPAGDEPSDDKPADDNKPAATTTTAEETTVTPAKTTAATTAAEKKGCGSAISLAALAIVPVLACGAAFVGKKKED